MSSRGDGGGGARKPAKKSEEFDASEMFLGDELDRETRMAVQSVLPDLMSGALFGEGLKGLGSIRSGGRYEEEKAPDAVDYEDISSSELEDEDEAEEQGNGEKEDRDALADGAGADEMARQLKLRMGLAKAQSKSTEDDYDDYDSESSTIPSLSASSVIPQTAPSKPENGIDSATPKPSDTSALMKEEMGLDDMERALFGDEDDEMEADSNIVDGAAELKSELKQREDSEVASEAADRAISTGGTADLQAAKPPTADLASDEASGAQPEPQPVLPPSIAAVLEGKAIVSTPSVKQICSALYTLNGPILKFSEIFGPQRITKRSRLRQISRLRARAAAAATAAASSDALEEEIDEEDIFYKLGHTFYIPKKEISDEEEEEDAGETELTAMLESSATKASEDSGEVVPSLKQDLPLRKDVTVPIPSPVHESIQTWPWENDIIWDEEDSKNETRASGEPTADLQTAENGIGTSTSTRTSDRETKPAAPSLYTDTTKPHQWGAVAPDGRSKSAPVASENPAVNELFEQLEEEPVVTPREWSLFAVTNEDFASGDWLDSVVWDDRHIPSSAFNNPLIFDLNDKEMLFEENVKKLEEEEQVNEEVPEEELLPVKKRRGRRPKRKIDEIANMVEDEVEEDLDPFNYSLDRIYANASRALARIRPKNMGKPVVQHSIPALKLSSFKTNFTPEELRLFHRPRTKLPASKKIKVTPTPMEGSRTNPRFKSGTIRRKRELSGKDGRIILAEYLEERPPLLSNVGMGTKILNYYRKKDVNDIPADKTREDGDMVLLDQTDECPFLGEVPTGDTVQMMDNNLFRAPIVRHNPPTTDFLLIRSKNKFYIREIPAIYAVGQEQPVTEVPAPNSRPANNFVKARLQTFIYRLFKKRANQQRVRISDICSAFPSHSETSIRKRLKDCSDFQRGGDDSGWWTLKKDFEMPSEEDLRAMLTPETVCAYESMLAGQQRLLDAGIEHTFNATGIVQAVAQLEQESGTRLKHATDFVKQEVCLAPWNSTGNFLSVQHGKGQLQLTGFGDPTGTNVGFSYMRVPQKVQAKQKKAQAPKTSVTGTDADLRKLSLEKARMVLLKFGVSNEVIEKLGRWELIDLVREKSSAAAGGIDDPNLTKFARGRRFNFQQQQQAYKDECARIFERQLAFLASTEPPDDISEDEDLEDLEDNVELQDFAGEMERELEALFGEDSNSELPELAPTKRARKPAAPRVIGRKKKDEDYEEEADRLDFQKFLEEARESKREQALQASATPQGLVRATMSTSTPVPTQLLSPVQSVITTTPSPTAVKKESEPIQESPFSPSTSEASMDGSSMPSAGGVPGGSPTEEGAKKTTRRFIKRTVTKKGPDGQPIRVVEIIRDPKKVEEYLKKSKAVKKNRPKLTAEEEAEKQRVRKEKRRLQEQLRRLKKNRERQLILAERLAEGNRDGTLSNAEGSNNQLVCGACGMVGHMRTNRNCPYYNEDQTSSVGAKPRRNRKRRRNVDYGDEDEDDIDLAELDDFEDEEPLDDVSVIDFDEQSTSSTTSTTPPKVPEGIVKVEGTKLRFPKAILSTITPTATPTTSVPTSPTGAGSTARSTKRAKVEPPKQPTAAAPTTPATTAAPSTPAAAPTTPTPAPQAGPTPAVAVITSDAGEKKLILRINKKEIARVSSKRAASSELSEPTYMLHPPKVPRGRRKSGRGAGVELASFLEKVVLRVKSYEGAYPFLYPVSTKEAPDYYKVIKNPMDLTTIHDKVKAFKYLSQKAFLADIRLMVSNCHKYCANRFPGLPPIADTLLKIALEALRENKDEIEELEALINADPAEATAQQTRTTTSAKQPTGVSTPKQSTSAAGSRTSSRPASKAPSKAGTPRATTPNSSVPASPTTSSSSFHFSSSPSSPVATPTPRVTSTATKVKIKLPKIALARAKEL